MEGMDSTCEAKTLQVRPPSLKQELEQKQSRLEEQLKDVKRIRQMLDENPTLAELHELMQRCRHY